MIAMGAPVFDPAPCDTTPDLHRLGDQRSTTTFFSSACIRGYLWLIERL
jgi:hypothetical protein